MQGDNQNPFDQLKHLSDLKDIKKLLGSDFFRNFSIPGMGSEESWDDEGEKATYPTLDMYDLGDEISIWAEIPGLRQADLSLHVTSYSVRIRGNVPSPSGRSNQRTLVSERFAGSFDRTVEFPDRVRPESAEAKYSTGLLIVLVRKFTPHDDEVNDSVQIRFEP